MRKHDFTPVLLALLLAGLCLVHLTGCAGKEPDPAEQSGPAAVPDPGPDTTQPSGERAEGLIHLFYDDEYSGSQKCVTLRETENGEYQFVSNLRCDGPAG